MVRGTGSRLYARVYQGIRIQEGNDPIPNLNPPEGVSQEQQISKLSYLSKLNQGFASQFPSQTELDARIASYELGFRMQAEAPHVIDLSRETEDTRRLYGSIKKILPTLANSA